MAKTKSTYNKKRSMRRSTRKAGMFGFSSAPKSWNDVAKIKLKEMGKPTTPNVIAAMAQYQYSQSFLNKDEYNKKYPGHQSWPQPMKVGGKRRRSKRSTKKAGNMFMQEGDNLSDLPSLAYAKMQNMGDSLKGMMFKKPQEGGKRRRSKRSTRKRGKKAGFKIGNMDFGDVRGNLGKLAAKSGMVSEDVFTKDRGMATGIGQGIRDAQTKMGELAAKSGMVDKDVFTKDRGMATGIGKFAKGSYNYMDSVGAVPHTSMYKHCQEQYINSGVIDDKCKGYMGSTGGKRRRSKTSKKSKKSTRKTRGGSAAARDFEAHLGPNATIKSGPITEQHKNSVRLALSAYGHDQSRAKLISQYKNLQNAMNGASDWSSPTVQAIASQIDPIANFDSEISI